jgi:hypothetical protein
MEDGIFQVSDGSTYESVEVKESFQRAARRCNSCRGKLEFERDQSLLERHELGLPSPAPFGLSSREPVGEAPSACPGNSRRPVSCIGSIIGGETTAGLPAASPLGLLATLLLTNP